MKVDNTLVIQVDNSPHLLETHFLTFNLRELKR